MIRRILFSFVLFFACISNLNAASQSVRWTFKEDPNADLLHVLTVLKTKTGVTLSPNDFMLVENRRLARTQFTMLVQTAGRIPIRSHFLRMWTDIRSGRLLQVEAMVATPPGRSALRRATEEESLSSEDTQDIVRAKVKRHWEDTTIQNVTWSDAWEGEDLVRVVEVKGRRGKHTLVLTLPEGTVKSHEFRPFARHDGQEEFNISVKIYPVYEEVENARKALLPRVASQLRYIQKQVRTVTGDPYAPLKLQRYLETKLDPVLGLTTEGKNQGLWAMSDIRAQARSIFGALPLGANAYSSGVLLQGRYATINLHPGVRDAFKNLSFTPASSGIFRPDWKPTPENDREWEMVPTSGLTGKPLRSETEAWERVARRLPDHNPVTYIEDGFDELQVYWAVNQMFDSLRPMGFTDPDLSTRPFHAFLYDPDITYRDNAYYTDDTINFTTYSAEGSNMARDNTTIWHELGHGVMDRLMGDHIRLADTGGLSEGMADFVAQLVLNDVTNGLPFDGKDNLRIFNNTGFHLTNEVHDDGESYGGAMNDLLLDAMKTHGRAGLTKVTDLTLEAMRLTRNHPGLTANGWFEHMLFADDVGNAPIRASGELRPLILRALAGRNFNLDGAVPAAFVIKNGDQELTAQGPGSRPNPILVTIKPEEKKTYSLKLQLKSTPTYAFTYPAKVTVQLRGGPLQGPLNWEGEAPAPLQFTLNSEADTLPVDLTIAGRCEKSNLPDGGCVDYASIQVWSPQYPNKPVAKKRFYLRLRGGQGR